MPIYQQTYRSFDGEVKRRFRWMVMVAQEWRIIRKRKFFWILCVPSVIYFILMSFYIYAIDLGSSVTTGPFAELTAELPVQNVDNDLFFTFIRFQSPFVFLIALYVGSGFISKDFRFNLVDIYFSKPLSWIDYVLGKVMTILFLGFGITLLPVCLLLIVHLIFAPELDTLREIYWIPLASLGFATVVALPCALAVLASSSFFNSQMFAGIAVFMVAMVNNAFGAVLAVLLEDEKYSMLAFGFTVNRIGEAIFRQANPVIDSSPTLATVYWAVMCLIALAIVCAKVRRAGAAS